MPVFGSPKRSFRDLKRLLRELGPARGRTSQTFLPGFETGAKLYGYIRCKKRPKRSFRDLKLHVLRAGDEEGRGPKRSFRDLKQGAREAAQEAGAGSQTFLPGFETARRGGRGRERSRVPNVPSGI